MKIFITGATGLLGGELLIRYSKREDVDKIYCLVRASDKNEARHRLERIFKLHDDYFDPQKVVPVIGDLLQENLSQELSQNSSIKDIDIIIHAAANTCFSRIYDKMVERTNIDGLRKILLWAKQLQKLDTFLYIGTATSCGSEIRNRTILEDESPKERVSHLVKYTYSKMMGELLLSEHLPVQKILIVRPSIIAGDSRPIVPRSPVILWAIATINELRLIPVNEHACLDMVPIDFVGSAIEKLLLTKRSHTVYHISSGEKAHTSALQLSHLLKTHYPDLPDYRFVDRPMLSQIKLWAKRTLSPASELYQFRQHLEYLDDKFEDRKQIRILLAGLEPYLDFIELGQVFDNSRLYNEIGMTSPGPAHEYLENSISYMKSINLLAGAVDA